MSTYIDIHISTHIYTHIYIYWWHGCTSKLVRAFYGSTPQGKGPLGWWVVVVVVVIVCYSSSCSCCWSSSGSRSGSSSSSHTMVGVWGEHMPPKQTSFSLAMRQARPQSFGSLEDGKSKNKKNGDGFKGVVSRSSKMLWKRQHVRISAFLLRECSSKM